MAFRWFQVTFPSGRFRFVRADDAREAASIIGAEYGVPAHRMTALRVRECAPPIAEAS